jgi:hypothetical protein
MAAAPERATVRAAPFQWEGPRLRPCRFRRLLRSPWCDDHFAVRTATGSTASTRSRPVATRSLACSIWVRSRRRLSSGAPSTGAETNAIARAVPFGRPGLGESDRREDRIGPVSQPSGVIRARGSSRTPCSVGQRAPARARLADLPALRQMQSARAPGPLDRSCTPRRGLSG